jgi:aminomuconate-semialdehyde/2-hydroxymuconate-6-semialdehyde dehydrogenase
MDKVLYYINLAREEGGTVVLGGDRATVAGECENGYFVNPTIITGLAHDTRVQQEEIFGPVVCVYPFSDEAHVIDWANSVKYGLSASVWTRDVKRAQRVALAIHSGTVWVNCWLVVCHLQCPRCSLSSL